MVAVTLQGADVGDTTSLVETAIAAAEHVEAAHAASPTPAALTELIADKGYHSNQTMVDLHAVGVRSYIAEPDRGRRHWTTAPEAQRPSPVIDAACAGYAARASYVDVVSTSNDPSLTCTTPAGCAALTCAGIGTSSNGW